MRLIAVHSLIFTVATIHPYPTNTMQHLLCARPLQDIRDSSVKKRGVIHGFTKLTLYETEANLDKSSYETVINL